MASINCTESKYDLCFGSVDIKLTSHEFKLAIKINIEQTTNTGFRLLFNISLCKYWIGVAVQPFKLTIII